MTIFLKIKLIFFKPNKNLMLKFWQFRSQFNNISIALFCLTLFSLKYAQNQFCLHLILLNIQFYRKRIVSERRTVSSIAWLYFFNFSLDNRFDIHKICTILEWDFNVSVVVVVFFSLSFVKSSYFFDFCVARNV